MFKVAILGYRAQGSNHHAPSFARLTDCQIVAVCDVVEERARAGADRYGVPAYTSVDEMLDAEDIDIVDIPVGEGYRYELVMKCLRRGAACVHRKAVGRGGWAVQNPTLRCASRPRDD